MLARTRSATGSWPMRDEIQAGEDDRTLSGEHFGDGDAVEAVFVVGDDGDFVQVFDIGETVAVGDGEYFGGAGFGLVPVGVVGPEE